MNNETVSRPNIVFLFSDQHAGGVYGAAGDEIADTPNIDYLAASGVQFSNCYCPSPLCIPSRMAFMTGQYPDQINVRTNRDYLPSDIPTFAHSLAASGYRTTLAGRMHFVGPDQLHGFQERLIGDISINWPGSSLIDFGPLNAGRGTKGPTLKYAGYGETAVHRYDQAVTDAACTYLSERGKPDSDNDAPFFLGVGWYGPHPPFIAPEQNYRYFEGRVPPAKYPKPDTDAEHPFIEYWRKTAEFDQVPPGADIIARTAYYGLVQMIDSHVGRVIDQLKAAGLDENTLIVYASDHGEQMGERGLWQKSTFFDHSSRVPLIMSWPGRVPAGQVRTQNVNLVDLTTTFTHAGNADPLPNSVGVDLVTVAQNDPVNENPVFSEFYGGLVSIEATSIVNRMVRVGNWKFNYYSGYPSELFDMVDDPDERNNLAEMPEHQETVEYLTQLILKNWDPIDIEEKSEIKSKNIDILKNWTKATNAVEIHRWVDPESENNWFKTD